MGSSESTVRIAVVGGGFGGSFHWHEHPRCRVEAVADPISDRRQRLVERYRCEKTYETLDQVLADDGVDAVAVFSGAPDHARHCIAVMDAGKHCFCAVPVAQTLEDCAAVIEAKERNGVLYMMAETSYYRWDTITARNLFSEGAFGELKYTEAEYYHPLIGAERDSLSYYEGKRTWRYGYPPMLYPTHSTAFLIGVSGERLMEVSCLGTRGADVAFPDNVYGNPFDNEVALFRTSGDHIFRCNVMWNTWNHGERAQWFGTDLSLFMEGWAGQPRVVKAVGKDDVTAEEDYWPLLPEAMRYDTGHGASHAFLTNEFVEAILGGREPTVNVYEAVAMTAPGIVAHQSAFRGGEQMKVPSFDPAA